MPFPPFRFQKDTLRLLDQRKLPAREVWIACRDAKRVHWAIREMVVRGAPAIGIVGGYGLYLGIRNFKGTRERFVKELRKQAEYLKSARPTGVNLRNVIEQIVDTIERRGGVSPPRLRAGRGNRAPTARDVAQLKQQVLALAKQAHREDDRLCRSIGKYGATLFREGDRVLTHCNAGGLATSGYGTALGVLYALKEKGKKFSVYADETRPLLQGARLTAWELVKSGIPCTLACDNAAASLMQAGKIDRIVVGADRIAANGDTANKIGTYNVAVLAKSHGIPFYIAAPSTSFDFKIKSGKEIPIENRADEEVTSGFGKRFAPRGVRVANPAFDVTPHAFITAFITEAGILRPPFGKSFSVIARQRPNVPKQSQRLLRRQKKAARNDRRRR